MFVNPYETHDLTISMKISKHPDCNKIYFLLPPWPENAPNLLELERWLYTLRETSLFPVWASYCKLSSLTTPTISFAGATV